MIISGFVQYVKQVWKNKPDTSTPLSAARLEHLEAGIKANSDAIAAIAAAVVNQQVNDVNKIPSSALLYQLNSDLSAKEFAFATNPDGVSNANIKCIQIGKLCVVNGTFRPRIAGTPLLLGSFAIMPKYGGYYPITAFDKVASFGTLSADGKFNCNIPTTLINEDCVVNFFYIVD